MLIRSAQDHLLPWRESFNFYVHRAGKTDDTACPDGCDAIMVLVPCPTLARNEDFASLPRDKAIAAYEE